MTQNTHFNRPTPRPHQMPLVKHPAARFYPDTTLKFKTESALRRCKYLSQDITRAIVSIESEKAKYSLRANASGRRALSVEWQETIRILKSIKNEVAAIQNELL